MKNIKNMKKYAIILIVAFCVYIICRELYNYTLEGYTTHTKTMSHSDDNLESINIVCENNGQETPVHAPTTVTAYDKSACTQQEIATGNCPSKDTSGATAVNGGGDAVNKNSAAATKANLHKMLLAPNSTDSEKTAAVKEATAKHAGADIPTGGELSDSEGDRPPVGGMTPVEMYNNCLSATHALSFVNAGSGIRVSGADASNNIIINSTWPWDNRGKVCTSIMNYHYPKAIAGYDSAVTTITDTSGSTPCLLDIHKLTKDINNSDDTYIVDQIAHAMSDCKITNFLKHQNSSDRKVWSRTAWGEINRARTAAHPAPRTRAGSAAPAQPSQRPPSNPRSVDTSSPRRPASEGRPAAPRTSLPPAEQSTRNGGASDFS